MQDSDPNLEYRQMLQNDLDARSRGNPSYSLRAFSRDIGLSPSRVSEILNGKQGLSKKRATEIAERLNFSEEQCWLFCNLVEAAHARSAVDRQAALLRLRKQEKHSTHFKLRLDLFKIIEDWYHLAIVELLGLRGARSEPEWLGERLGMDTEEVVAALERLQRVGLLQKVRRKWVPTSDGGSVAGEVPSESIRRFHRQLLHKAIEALDDQDLEKREFGASVVAIDSSDVPAAKSAVSKFRRSFCKRFSQGETKDKVYCLTTQLFSLEKES